jgi:hypothetical protein
VHALRRVLEGSRYLIENYRGRQFDRFACGETLRNIVLQT